MLFIYNSYTKCRLLMSNYVCHDTLHGQYDLVYLVLLSFLYLLTLLKISLPGGDLLASLHGHLFSFIQLGLHVLDLVVQGLPVLLAHLGVLLLQSELVSQPGGINHGLLGSLLGHLALSQHLLKISLANKS